MTSFALRKKPTNLKRYMYPNVLSSIVYNCKDMEATKCTSTDEFFFKKKRCEYIYTVKYDSAGKNKE